MSRPKISRSVTAETVCPYSGSSAGSGPTAASGTRTSLSTLPEWRLSVCGGHAQDGCIIEVSFLSPQTRQLRVDTTRMGR